MPRIVGKDKTEGNEGSYQASGNHEQIIVPLPLVIIERRTPIGKTRRDRSPQ